jgi:hypothetical protein
VEVSVPAATAVDGARGSETTPWDVEVVKVEDAEEEPVGGSFDTMVELSLDPPRGQWAIMAVGHPRATWSGQEVLGGSSVVLVDASVITF